MKRYILLCISIAMILSLASCTKKEDEDTSSNEGHNYAVNPVADRDVLPSGGETIEGIVEDSPNYIDKEQYEMLKEIYGEDFDPADYGFILKEDTVSIGEIEHIEHEFNIDEDINASKVTTLDEISIDGNLIKFPISFNDIVDNYEIYGDAQSHDWYENALYTETAVKIKTSGAGSFNFIFSSESGKAVKLSELMCKEITLYANDEYGEKLTSIALPGGIKFGSTFKDITDFYGKPIEYESDDDENIAPTTFYIKYSINEDGNIISFEDYEENNIDLNTEKFISFTGYDGGVVMINIHY